MIYLLSEGKVVDAEKVEQVTMERAYRFIYNLRVKNLNQTLQMIKPDKPTGNRKK